MRDSSPQVGGKIATGRGNLGSAMFAGQDIKEGEEILRFVGRRITFEEAVAKGERQSDTLQIGDDLYLDLEEPGRSVNHSCDPNAGIADDLRLVAIRDIEKGEEIRFDYSTTMAEDYWTMECHCGSASCRGVVKDFKDLPHDLQQKYLELGVVERFIVEQRWSLRESQGRHSELAS